MPEKELYLGAKAEKMLTEIGISPEELKKLKTNVLAFYVELASQIRKRFDFANPLLTFLSNFDPETTSGKVRSIIGISDYIPQLRVANLETLNSEWRLFS